MKQIFLFQKRPEGLSPGRRGLFWAWNWVLLMGAGRYLTADGTLTHTLTEEQQALAHRFAILDYDRTKNFRSTYGKE